ncbi:mitochondrial carrier [Coemansia reversa NRRL 1564]|uniref:Mitochondrial carrier n=1 Tax=Coemansia reversa (strain ATCC 12441 / NRRL 1564) TaxID=763665 RepID=A0A2G5BD72_COERN|nr:mitochondrial carrier [Coemansia reversa NRRL 1564]|eukprot:PIA16960.1 mitochondrial carrier [Coemansia reversa NRRL 1564]
MSEAPGTLAVFEEPALDGSSGSGGGWKDFAAGSLAGAAQVAVGHPLDTVKVRMQIEKAGIFKGPMDCFMKTIRNEGFLGLYKGMASPLVGISAVNSLLFWAYSYGRTLQTGSATATPTLGQVAIAGAGAGAVNSILASPVELLKVRLQVQYNTAVQGSAVFRGPVPLARHLFQKFGARGITWGFWATVAREIPANAAFYTGFEFAKRCLADTFANGDSTKLSPLLLMLSGSIGGVSYWTASYPLDVIKSRVQNGKEPPKGFGYILSTAKTIAAEQGIRGFFRGFSPSVIRSVPAAGVTFATYELVMRALNNNQ